MLGNIPVLAYHQVGKGCDISPEVFRQHLEFIKDEGFTTLFISEVVDIMLGKRKMPHKPIALTFDDGFIDFWLNAFPLLSEMQMKATIFLTVGRIGDYGIRDNTYPVRSMYEINYDLANVKEPSPDYVSWQEVVAMIESGLVEPQAHTMWHARFFYSDRVIGFYTPQTTKWHLAWATEGDRRLGIALFPHRSGAIVRRFYPSRTLYDRLANFVEERGEEEFFHKGGWKRQLLQLVERYRQENGALGAFEEKDSFIKRLYEEYIGAKELLQERTGRVCDIFAWPWGEWSWGGVKLLREAGYKGAVITNIRVNTLGSDPYFIGRFMIRGKRSFRHFRRRLLILSHPFRSRVFVGLRFPKRRRGYPSQIGGEETFENLAYNSK